MQDDRDDLLNSDRPFYRIYRPFQDSGCGVCDLFYLKYLPYRNHDESGWQIGLLANSENMVCLPTFESPEEERQGSFYSRIYLRVSQIEFVTHVLNLKAIVLHISALGARQRQ